MFKKPKKAFLYTSSLIRRRRTNETIPGHLAPYAVAAAPFIYSACARRGLDWSI